MQASRERKLRSVFRKFDLDNSGSSRVATISIRSWNGIAGVITKLELMELGKARRKAGQKSGEWNETKNQALVGL